MSALQQIGSPGSDAVASSSAKGRIKIHLESCEGILHKRKTYAYYIAFRLDSPGRPIIRERSRPQNVSANGKVVWNEELYMDGANTASLRMRLYEDHDFTWDHVVCELTMPLDSLLSKDEVSLASRDGVLCTLHLTVTEVRDGGHEEMTRVVTSAQVPGESRTANVVSHVDDMTTAVEPVVAVLKQWESLLDKIGAVVEIVKTVAEIHPYTSVAWSVISAGYVLAKKQKERDESVAKLVDALNSAYDIVLATDGLSNASEAQSKTIGALIKQTIDCGHFVNSYMKKSFWGRAIRGAMSSADKDIAEYREQLLKLQANLTTHSAFVTQGDVHFILGNTKRMADNVDLLNMQYTRTARWRSGKRCLSGTRVALISEILRWAHASDDDAPRILLLSGVAGVGKSSVAHTIASCLEDSSRLAASYCFDRNDLEHHRPNLLLPTIARHLADTHLPFRHALANANSAATFGSPDLDDQFDNLLRKPLDELTCIGPLVIVVDALDESGDVQTREKMLAILANRFLELPQSFRLLLTSRPEDDVMQIFNSKQHVLCKAMDAAGASAINDDITAFVASKLVDRDGQPLPIFNSHDYARLAVKSEGLFQWAAIACTTIAKGNHPSLPPTTAQMRRSFEHLVSLPSSALDQLYDDVLGPLIPESSNEGQLLLRALGLIVVSREPLNANTVFELLRLSDEQKEFMQIMLRGLGSVLIGAASMDQPIRTLHSSFRDFLLWSVHNIRFHVNYDELDQEVFLGCLHVLNKRLSFNICRLESSYLANKDIPYLHRLIEENVTSSLSYAVRFLRLHLPVSAAKQWSQMVLSELRTLLFDKFLFWLELSSILGALADIPSPQVAEIGGATLRCLDRDCRGFLSDFYEPISRSAPHVYISAYALAPVYKQWWPGSRRHFARLLLAAKPAIDNSNKLQVITLASLAFSSDGSQIAAGSECGMVWIWNTKDGTDIRGPLDGHTARVNSLAFSPDGSNVVSGSTDRTMQLWDAESGMSMGTVSCKRGVSTVSFSPDGTHFACGLYDGTVQSWDIQTLAPVTGPLVGHKKRVHSLAYSRDGHSIISGSHFGAVYIWNSRTGALASSRPCIGRTENITAVAVSSDGQYVASGSWSDNTVYVWSTEDSNAGGPLFSSHTTGPIHLAFARDGRLISCSSDKTVRIWNISEASRTLRMRTFAPSSSLAPRPHSKDEEDAVTHDGWVKDTSCTPPRYLIWIPERYRKGLYSPLMSHIISDFPTYKLDLSSFAHGIHWTDCFEGDSRTEV
ncbi:hypothetical protein PENSPDRAFT_717594 [Peniophora sp. CONT]|nr:hypothetical protein PENSPDRAFT_717594 [Peniophora sp. CONT]